MQTRRVWGERQIDDCETDEDYSPEWLHAGREDAISTDNIQEFGRLHESARRGHAAI